jgi:hypothetical protein
MYKTKKCVKILICAFFSKSLNANLFVLTFLQLSGWHPCCFEIPQFVQSFEAIGTGSSNMRITNELNITAVMQHNRFPIRAQNVLYRMLSCPKLKMFKIQSPITQ